MKYDVFISKEATQDIWNIVRYIAIEFCDANAAMHLQTELKNEINGLKSFPFKNPYTEFEYRGYIIYKKTYRSYLIFYFVDSNEKYYHFSLPISGNFPK
ncbi:MAG: type II toxin-antitoxin system RelE/ParE family toxin [Agathobacter sp.]|nr:type II toxin-antitoxin system RelE/ParE family toxin [Agathobacter sp.]